MAARAVVDLHCHTSASFDSLSDPLAVARTAAQRGITHLAITDHDRIDGALRARDAAIPGLTVIVGSEVRTRQGDLIALFLERPIAAGLPASEAIAAIRDQGGLVGIPHPFDGWRGSLLRDEVALSLVSQVDWIEGWNARLVAPGGNQRASELAIARELRHLGVIVGIGSGRQHAKNTKQQGENDPDNDVGVLHSALELWSPSRGHILSSL